jgi:hypothetical protein
MRLIILVSCGAHSLVLFVGDEIEGRGLSSIPGARIILVFEVFLVLKLEKPV